MPSELALRGPGPMGTAFPGHRGALRGHTGAGDGWYSGLRTPRSWHPGRVRRPRGDPPGLLRHLCGKRGRAGAPSWDVARGAGRLGATGVAWLLRRPGRPRGGAAGGPPVSWARKARGLWWGTPEDCQQEAKVSQDRPGWSRAWSQAPLSAGSVGWMGDSQTGKAQCLVGRGGEQPLGGLGFPTC